MPNELNVALDDEQNALARKRQSAPTPNRARRGAAREAERAWQEVEARLHALEDELRRLRGEEERP